MTNRNIKHRQDTKQEPRRAKRTLLRQRPSHIRRLLVLVAGLVVALLLVCVAVVAQEPVNPVRSTATTLTPRTDPPTTASTTTTLPQGKRTYAVGEVSKSWVEGEKTVVIMANGQTRSPRVLVANILYPATGLGANAQQSDAPPAQSDGPFPLLIFGPGFDQPTMSYKLLLEHWAHSGFVVAALTFPGTAPGASGGPTENDLINQPGDVTYAITALEQLSSQPNHILSAMVNPEEVAVVGQSDGGNTALAVSYDTTYLDPRVKAVVVLSGAEYGIPGASWFPSGSPPLLAFQGTNDKTNYSQWTNDYFASATSPKYLDCLQGADHLNGYDTASSFENVVATVTTDFFDAELYHLAGRIHQMKSDGTIPGTAFFASSCPGPPPPLK